MSRDKQIKDIVKDICPFYKKYGTCEECDSEIDIEDEPCYWVGVAECIALNDYRKTSEVAREIFEEIDTLIVRRMIPDIAWIDDRFITDITKLKKKYESEGEG